MDEVIILSVLSFIVGILISRMKPVNHDSQVVYESGNQPSEIDKNFEMEIYHLKVYQHYCRYRMNFLLEKFSKESLFFIGYVDEKPDLILNIDSNDLLMNKRRWLDYVDFGKRNLPNMEPFFMNEKTFFVRCQHSQFHHVQLFNFINPNHRFDLDSPDNEKMDQMFIEEYGYFY